MRKLYVNLVFEAALAVFILSIGVALLHPGESKAQHQAIVTVSYSALMVPRHPVVVESKRVTPASSYTVRTGDTLGTIAKRMYGSANSWPALWWINKHTVTNPNSIRTGQVLRLSSWHPVLAWLLQVAQRSVPHIVTASVSRSANVSYSTTTVSGPWPGGWFGNCVVRRESGGNPQVMNASGHYGLYQFSLGTWIAYGGSPALFGHASVAYQERIFLNALSRGGESNWSPYDGC